MRNHALFLCYINQIFHIKNKDGDLKMKILMVVIFVLVIRSAAATIIIKISKGNENIINACALGGIGCILAEINLCIHEIQNFFKYHFKKRSIFQSKEDSRKYICKVKYCNTINENGKYLLIKRYAIPKEWMGIPEFPHEYITKCINNNQ